MNVSLLECMIRPLRVRQEKREEEESRQNSIPSLEPDGELTRTRMQHVPRRDSIVPSKSIPISNIKRTPSEIQLHEDEAMADYRDYCFYVRLVNGMNDRRDHCCSGLDWRSTDQCLANIMRTRNLPVMEDSLSLEGLYQHDRHRKASSNLPKQSQIYLNASRHQDDREEGIFIFDMD